MMIRYCDYAEVETTGVMRLGFRDAPTGITLVHASNPVREVSGVVLGVFRTVERKVYHCWIDLFARDREIVFRVSVDGKSIVDVKSGLLLEGVQASFVGLGPSPNAKGPFLVLTVEVAPV